MRDWLFHDAAGFFTLCVAIIGLVQLGLFYRQLRLIRQSLEDAKITASAAKTGGELALKEFAATHRPKIRLKHLWFVSNVWQGEQIIVDLNYVNVGPTAAVIKFINYRTLIIPQGSCLPQRPPYNTNTNIPFAVPHQALESGVTGSFQAITDGRILTRDQIDAIRQGRDRLYFIGSIAYTNIDGQQIRQTAFARYIEFATVPAGSEDAGRFRKEDDPDYEYED